VAVNEHRYYASGQKGLRDHVIFVPVEFVVARPPPPTGRTVGGQYVRNAEINGDSRPRGR